MSRVQGRPCSSRGREVNRFTRVEIDALAKNYGISTIDPVTKRPMVMTRLCKIMAAVLDGNKKPNINKVSVSSLKEEIQALRRELVSLDNVHAEEKRQLLAEATLARQQLNAAMVSAAGSEAELSQLKRQIQRQAELEAALQQAENDLRETRNRHLAEREEWHAKELAVQQNIVAVRAELGQHRQSVQNAVAQKDQAERNKAQLMEQHNRLLRNSERNKASMEAQVSDLRQQLNVNRQGRQHNQTVVTGLLQALQQAERNRARIVSESDAQLHDVEVRMQEAQRQVNLSRNLMQQQQEQRHQNAIQALRKNHEAALLESQKATLQREADAIKQEMVDLKQVQEGELARAQQVKADLEKRVIDLQANVGAQEGALAEAAAIKTQYDQIRQEYREVKEQHAAEKQALESAIQRHTNALQSQVNLVSKLQNNLRVAGNREGVMEGQHKDLLEEHKSLSEHYTNLQGRHAALQRQIEAMEEKTSNANFAMAALGAAHNKALANHAQLQEVSNALRANKQALQDSLNQLQRNGVSKNEAHDALVQQHAALQSQYAALLAQQNEAGAAHNRNYAQLRNTASSLQANKQALQDSLHELQRNQTSKNEAHDALVQQHAALQNRHLALQGQHNALSTQARNHQIRETALAEARNKALANHAQLRNVAEALQGNKQSLEATLQALRAQIQDCKDKLSEAGASAEGRRRILDDLERYKKFHTDILDAVHGIPSDRNAEIVARVTRLQRISRGRAGGVAEPIPRAQIPQVLPAPTPVPPTPVSQNDNGEGAWFGGGFGGWLGRRGVAEPVQEVPPDVPQTNRPYHRNFVKWTNTTDARGVRVQKRDTIGRRGSRSMTGSRWREEWTRLGGLANGEPNLARVPDRWPSST